MLCHSGSSRRGQPSSPGQGSIHQRYHLQSRLHACSDAERGSRHESWKGQWRQSGRCRTRSPVVLTPNANWRAAILSAQSRSRLPQLLNTGMNSGRAAPVAANGILVPGGSMLYLNLTWSPQSLFQLLVPRYPGGPSQTWLEIDGIRLTGSISFSDRATPTRASAHQDMDSLTVRGLSFDSPKPASPST